MHGKARGELVLEVTDLFGEHNVPAALVGKDELERGVGGAVQNGLRDRHDWRDAGARGDGYEVWVFQFLQFLAHSLGVVEAGQVGL